MRDPVVRFNVVSHPTNVLVKQYAMQDGQICGTKPPAACLSGPTCARTRSATSRATPIRACSIVTTTCVPKSSFSAFGSRSNEPA